MEGDFEQKKGCKIGAERVLAELLQNSAGGIAGLVGKSCTAPLSRFTILFQIGGMVLHQQTQEHYHPSKAAAGEGHQSLRFFRRIGSGSIFREVSRVISEEGVRSLWKGNGAALLHRIPYSSLSFYSYERYKEALASLKSSLSTTSISGCKGAKAAAFSSDATASTDMDSQGVGARLLAGGAAGMTAISVTYPLDLVRARLAVQGPDKYYKGLVHAFLRIPKEEGLKSLYNGMGATLLTAAPGMAINFCAYETLKAFWRDSTGSHRQNSSSAASNGDALPHAVPSPWMSMAFGSMSAMASCTLTFPLDLVRRRRQVEGAAHTPVMYEKKRLWSMLLHVARTEGFCKGLFRGIAMEYLRVVPSVGITFATYESLKGCSCANFL